MENDNAQSVYKIPEVKKVVFNNGNYTVNLNSGHTENFSISKIKSVTFNNAPAGCTDPLAYNYNSTASISDPCKYVALETKNPVTAIDTVGTNPMDACDSVDLKTTIDHAQIISQLIFGQKIQITWEIKQNNNNVHLKALYDLPKKNGAVLFTLTLKCKKPNKTARTTGEETTYRTFGDVILLGPTQVNEVIENNSSLICYPNPTERLITIEAVFNKNNNPVIIDILDANGAQVKRVETSQKSHKIVEVINIQDLAPGIYLCKVVSGEKVLYKKIIKL
jgi:hypothetical protein